jgi:hypothetical protein
MQWDTLKTDRLRFGPLNDLEYANFVSIYSDPIVMKNFTAGAPHSKEKIKHDFRVECEKWRTGERGTTDFRRRIRKLQILFR